VEPLDLASSMAALMLPEGPLGQTSSLHAATILPEEPSDLVPPLTASTLPEGVLNLASLLAADTQPEGPLDLTWILAATTQPEE